MFSDDKLAILEALLFLQTEPVRLNQIEHWLTWDAETVHDRVNALSHTLEETHSGLTIQWVDGGVRLVTRPELARILAQALEIVDPEPLSHASWEVLSIVAYQQPITRLEIEAIRQTGSDRAIETLINRELIEEVGRKESPGRPILYGTTHQFMEQFGLHSLDQLPPLTADPSPRE